MNKTELQEILKKHQKWLNDVLGGVKANLSNTDLSNANLGCVTLNGADLNSADLSNTDLNGANLSYANLRYAKLNGADLRYAKLIGADLSYSDLSDVYLGDTFLSGADLSGAKGIVSTIDFMKTHFEQTDEGYIAYKTFNEVYSSPTQWDISPSSILTENVNFDRFRGCGCGINVATLEWIQNNCSNRTIWKVLIRWEWLCGICVPYNSDGKIRCERVELIEIVK